MRGRGGRGHEGEGREGRRGGGDMRESGGIQLLRKDSSLIHQFLISNTWDLWICP